MQLERQRQRQWHPAQQADDEIHQDQSGDGAERGDPEALDQQLLREPAAARAERDANGDLAAPAAARASSRPATFAQAIARISPTATSSIAKKAPTVAMLPNCSVDPTGAKSAISPRLAADPEWRRPHPPPRAPHLADASVWSSRRRPTS